MPSPLGESSRSECLAGMDMLHEMFERQARRLESQLYQRAQDQQRIQIMSSQAHQAAQQVRQLEQLHVEQAARIRQGTIALQKLREQLEEMARDYEAACSACAAHESDLGQLRAALQAARPGALESLALHAGAVPSAAVLREKAEALRAGIHEASQTFEQQIGATPLTAVAMSSDFNPLHDLSAVADYASKASPRAASSAPE